MHVNIDWRRDQKFVLTLFAAINIVFGIVILPYYVYLVYNSIPTDDPGYPDFIVYYSAGHMIREASRLLYDYPAYLHFYSMLRPIVYSVSFPWFGYLAPPPLAVFFLPFSYMSLQKAYVVWSLLNFIFCALLIRATVTLAQLMRMQDIRLFLGSCVLGVWVTSNVILKGQLSVMTCLFLTYFFIYVLRNKTVGCALCLAAMLQIKPPLFLPLFLYMAGCRQWRVIQLVILYSCVLIIVTLPFLGGPHVWLDYVQIVRQFSSSYGDLGKYYESMINISSVFWGILDGRHSALLINMGKALYLVACALSFLLAWIPNRKPDVIPAAAAMLAGIFFSIYSPIHDALLLLPVCVVITAALRACNNARWMFLCYIMASYGLVQIWWIRTIAIVLGIALSYMVMNISKYSMLNGPAIDTAGEL